MRKSISVIAFVFSAVILQAQSVTQRLQQAFSAFENDKQLQHAISSLYVIDAATGEVLFQKNSSVGLAPASTQKIITSATAFELLGAGFRFKTEFELEQEPEANSGYARLVVTGFADPTFGSFRYTRTEENNVLRFIIQQLQQKSIRPIESISILSDSYDERMIPGGWIYDDIGNYYGAGAAGFSWHENQYDLVLIPGAQKGDKTAVDSTNPHMPFFSFDNFCTTGAPGSGDQAYIYAYPGSDRAMIKGTIPAGVKRFTISGAITQPGRVFGEQLARKLQQNAMAAADIPVNVLTSNSGPGKIVRTPLFTFNSPSLDSVNYWFLKKSINLYGEALVKAIAYNARQYGSTDSGIAVLRRFWKKKGLDEEELNMYDGSGLSPQNRVTTHAQVEILSYARTRPWFNDFFNGFPEYNGMRIKSGTIGDVKGFCGYHRGAGGREYIFSFLVNNYSGKTSALVNKMYKVLDELKK